MEDKEKSKNEETRGIPVPQTSANRVRNDSESSTGNDDQNKRQRTVRHFMVNSATAASPPKFVSLEEIMQAANGMTNMALVHQIAVDQNFKLTPAELPENSFEKKVTDTMKRAFWDVLREQLNEDPPNYSHALVLLEDIKQGLFSVLLPQHTKIKQQIEDVLDSHLIKQQAENGILDFKHYAQYVISVMSKLCAPVRDDKVKELMETDDVVETFRGILEMLDLMALDMANFAIEIVRPDIIAQSVEFERQKFADFLKIQADGLQHTRNWLNRHFISDEGQVSNPDPVILVRNKTTQVLNDAYMELLEWDHENEYPETFMLDEDRLKTLKDQTQQLSVIGTILLVVTMGAPGLQSDVNFKNLVKQKSVALIQNIGTSEELNALLPGIADILIKEVKESITKQNIHPISAENEKLLHGQIVEVGKTDHRIRQLVWSRIREFMHQVISSPTAAPQQVPPGLSSLQKELTLVAGQFLRIVAHNRAVYSQYYIDIVEEAMKVANVN